MRKNLYSIDINVAGREYSFIEFHFYLLKESRAEFKAKEVERISLCRSLLDEVYDLIGIIADAKIPEVNKLVQPSIKYGETCDKEHRFFEVMFTLGNVKVNRADFQNFGCCLVLRENGSLHTIDNGRFDFELQALQQHQQYVNCLEGFQTDVIAMHLDGFLPHLAVPIKVLIEKIKKQRLSAIHLAAFETAEFGHKEGMGGERSDGFFWNVTGFSYRLEMTLQPLGKSRRSSHEIAQDIHTHGTRQAAKFLWCLCRSGTKSVYRAFFTFGNSVQRFPHQFFQPDRRASAVNEDGLRKEVRRLSWFGCFDVSFLWHLCSSERLC